MLPTKPTCKNKYYQKYCIIKSLVVFTSRLCACHCEQMISVLKLSVQESFSEKGLRGNVTVKQNTKQKTLQFLMKTTDAL